MGEVTPIPTKQPETGISPPVAISTKHDLSKFDCDKPSLNEWLRTHALTSEAKSARTFVVCVGNEVIAYYTLAAGSVTRKDTPSAMRHGLPDPVPIMLIGRLAVDKRYQKRRIGSGLLKDALLRILNAAKEVGARAVVVHAIDDDAVVFYNSFKFKPFPAESKTLFLPIEHIAAQL